MVYLYSIISNLVQKRLQYDHNNYDYDNWNWVIYFLTKYIYKYSVNISLENYPQYYDPQYSHPGFTVPEMPEENKGTIWSFWFYKVNNLLSEQYFDITPEYTFKSITNPRTEEISMIIFDATPLIIQRSFIKYLTAKIASKEKKIKRYELRKTNPAEC